MLRPLRKLIESWGTPNRGQPSLGIKAALPKERDGETVVSGWRPNPDVANALISSKGACIDVIGFDCGHGLPHRSAATAINIVLQP
jgi:hypothetical protein